jgi:hypothetical protein
VDGQKLFGTAHVSTNSEMKIPLLLTARPHFFHFSLNQRILDAQMDILETRDDEDTAVSAINIIGIISLRHPQAFKTRFWVCFFWNFFWNFLSTAYFQDLMDLLIGWYVDATPSDRVFDVCLVAFGLFREKFKQEIDYAWRMAKEFTQEMEAAVKAVGFGHRITRAIMKMFFFKFQYHKTDQNSIDLEQRGIFLAFFQYVSF